jgi:hypothetical protein
MESRVLIFLYGVPEQPAPACRWLDIWHKTKSHIRLSHVTSVLIVKQQDGDKIIIIIVIIIVIIIIIIIDL